MAPCSMRSSHSSPGSSRRSAAKRRCPASFPPPTAHIKNPTSTRLNGQPLKEDLEGMLRRPLRLANDADCLALSEASDCAAAGGPCVFAALLGTRGGGGIVVNGHLVTGPNAIGGEWGHNALPWPRPEWNEVPGPVGWE